MEISNLLNEYATICINLEKIKEKIYNIRNITKEKIILAQTPDEKNKIFSEFQQIIAKIKNDKAIEQKYITLRERKNELHNKIVSLCKQDTQDLEVLFTKYLESPAPEMSEMEIDNISMPGRKKDITVTDIHYSEQHNEINNLVKTIKLPSISMQN